MIWHIVTLEALLGEGKATEGVTSLVAKRIGINTGDKENVNIYKDLYKIRSKLVHGVQSDKKLYTTHLFYSRFFARKVLLWFLNCLNKIAENLPKDVDFKNIPARRDILQFVDLNTNERVNQVQLNYIYSSDFPDELNWLILIIFPIQLDLMLL